MLSTNSPLNDFDSLNRSLSLIQQMPLTFYLTCKGSGFSITDQTLNSSDEKIQEHALKIFDRAALQSTSIDSEKAKELLERLAVCFQNRLPRLVQKLKDRLNPVERLDHLVQDSTAIDNIDDALFLEQFIHLKKIEKDFFVDYRQYINNKRLYEAFFPNASIDSVILPFLLHKNLTEREREEKKLENCDGKNYVKNFDTLLKLRDLLYGKNINDTVLKQLYTIKHTSDSPFIKNYIDQTITFHKECLIVFNGHVQVSLLNKLENFISYYLNEKKYSEIFAPAIIEVLSSHIAKMQRSSSAKVNLVRQITGSSLASNLLSKDLIKKYLAKNEESITKLALNCASKPVYTQFEKNYPNEEFLKACVEKLNAFDLTDYIQRELQLSNESTESISTIMDHIDRYSTRPALNSLLLLSQEKMKIREENQKKWQIFYQENLNILEKIVLANLQKKKTNTQTNKKTLSTSDHESDIHEAKNKLIKNQKKKKETLVERVSQLKTICQPIKKQGKRYLSLNELSLPSVKFAYRVIEWIANPEQALKRKEYAFLEQITDVEARRIKEKEIIDAHTLCMDAAPLIQHLGLKTIWNNKKENRLDDHYSVGCIVETSPPQFGFINLCVNPETKETYHYGYKEASKLDLLEMYSEGLKEKDLDNLVDHVSDEKRNLRVANTYQPKNIRVKLNQRIVSIIDPNIDKRKIKLIIPDESCQLLNEFINK